MGNNNKYGYEGKNEEYNERLGINGYYKTDLDLEIEKELLESSNENQSESNNSVAKRIRLISMIPLIIALILSLIRIVRTFI
ncbi:hypothetical protein ACUW9V_001457 [Staphylococcus epidermidis]|uniref:hypothetical protein n=1 Tax=Staphylococcus epidermidis TaxID=1282 RepID=UPI0016424F4A|nr:hypothetical protein [Staphylococcus epidermidis]MBC2966318.1 hypothetical protein [Staphylococcus epidermidis]MBC3110447.1 hypothetical protein [Staphylococcus epidermidis]